MENISKTTMLVLLILTILISMVSTWIVLDGISGLGKESTTEQQTESVGVSSEQTPFLLQQPISKSGQVSFTILEGGNQNE